MAIETPWTGWKAVRSPWGSLEGYTADAKICYHCAEKIRAWGNNGSKTNSYLGLTFEEKPKVDIGPSTRCERCASWMAQQAFRFVFFATPEQFRRMVSVFGREDRD